MTEIDLVLSSKDPHLNKAEEAIAQAQAASAAQGGSDITGEMPGEGQEPPGDAGGFVPKLRPSGKINSSP